MGIAIVPFFGDMSKEELEKELKKVNLEIERLSKDKMALEDALKSYDSATKG